MGASLLDAGARRDPRPGLRAGRRGARRPRSGGRAADRRWRGAACWSRSRWRSPGCWWRSPTTRRRPARRAARRSATALIGDIDRESTVSDGLDRPARDAPQPRCPAPATALLAATGVGQRGARPARPRRAGGGGRARSPVPGCSSPWPTPTPKADGDPVGGRRRADPRGQVRDGDLQLVVNALWAAGAEAISINGQRLGPTTRDPVRRRGGPGRLPPGHQPLPGQRHRRPRHAVPALPRQPGGRGPGGHLRVLRSALRLRPGGPADACPPPSPPELRSARPVARRAAAAHRRPSAPTTDDPGG